MNDTHHPERDVIGLLDRAGIEPTDTFRSQLAHEIRAIAAGDNVATIQSARADRARRNLIPTLAGAAAVAALVVTIAVVAARGDAGLTPADPTIPTPDSERTRPTPGRGIDPSALTDTDLFGQLENRRWLALDRFDVPVEPSLVSRIVVSGSPENIMLTGHDGCNRYGGRFTFDGRAVSTDGTAVPSDGFVSEERDCDLDVLQLDAGHRIELLADADEFVLRDADGAPLARFVDEQSLPLATADDIVDTWYLDGLSSVEVFGGGVGRHLCFSIRWTDTESRVVFELNEDARVFCSEDDILPTPEYVFVLGELLETRPEARLSPRGLVLTNGTSAILFQRPPVVEADPSGVTVGAGALFGFEPGLGVDPDGVIRTASPVLGAPDQDTGWIDARGLETQSPARCQGEYRELVWGDLVAGFARVGARTELLFWNVGDQRSIVGNLSFDERAFTSASELVTEDGVRIGDPTSAVVLRFGMTVSEWTLQGDDGGEIDAVRLGVTSRAPDARVGGIEQSPRGGWYLAVDGTIVAFGAGDASC